VLISFLLYEEVLGQTRLRMSLKIKKKRCTVNPHRNVYRLLEDIRCLYGTNCNVIKIVLSVALGHRNNGSKYKKKDYKAKV